MSWALNLDNGVERLITYEALLRSLFATARATGLCLYDRSRMPLSVIDGALCTHPIERREGTYRPNPFYDASVDSLKAANRKMMKIGPPAIDSYGGSRARPRPTGERKR
jgi:hypothetical protein